MIILSCHDQAPETSIWHSCSMHLQVMRAGQAPAARCAHQSVNHRNCISTTHRQNHRHHRVHGVSTAEASSTVQQLSLLLLACENLRRRLGRTLLEEDAYLRATEHLSAAPYALLMLGPSPAQGACEVIYANEAASSALQACTANQQLAAGATLQLPVPLAAAKLQLHAGTLVHQAFECAQWQPTQDSEVLSIDQLLLFPLQAPNDEWLGVGALFDAWTFADGSFGRPGVPRIAPGQVPDAAALQEAADAVRAQADAIRQLKQSQGLGNKDQAVIDAVAELQKRKGTLANLERVQLAVADNSPSVVARLLDGSSRSGISVR